MDTSINITPSFQGGDLLPIMQGMDYFGNDVNVAKRPPLMMTRVLSRNEMRDMGDEDPTSLYIASDMVWSRSNTQYHAEVPLNYYLHLNPQKAGVSILEINLNKMEGPHFISSARLSGCIYAWFLSTDRRVILLHAGAQGTDDQPDKTIRDRDKRRDIVNGLQITFGHALSTWKEDDSNNNSTTKNDIEPNTKWMNELNSMQEIITGQIIYPGEVDTAGCFGKLRTVSYSTAGEALCIISQNNPFLISGIMSTIRYPKYQRGGYQIYCTNGDEKSFYLDERGVLKQTDEGCGCGCEIC